MSSHRDENTAVSGTLAVLDEWFDIPALFHAEKPLPRAKEYMYPSFEVFEGPGVFRLLQDAHRELLVEYIPTVGRALL